MSSLKIQISKQRKMMRTRVVRVTRLTPHFVNVTLASEDIADFDYLGLDQCVRLFFPRPGQRSLRMPTASGNGWIAQFYLLPSSVRPHVRNYTIRAHRPELGEVDIEFVAHGDDSPASYWATHAQPGDEAGLFPEGIQYLPPTDTNSQLIVGDESAVPAILSILEQSPPELRAKVLLEVPTTEDIRQTPHLHDVEVHWLPRDGREGAPGELALETLRRAKPPAADAYSFIVGESALATGARRHLVAQGVPKSNITFIGYWKVGRASLG